MASYLTEAQAEARLDSRFGIEAAPLQGDIDLASWELESMGPFIGAKLVTDGSQSLAFPRSVTPEGATNAETTPPDAILDWVALAAYRLSTDDGPAVTSESVGSISVSYAQPKLSQSERRMWALLQPYLLRMGRSVGTITYNSRIVQESQRSYGEAMSLISGVANQRVTLERRATADDYGDWTYSAAEMIPVRYEPDEGLERTLTGDERQAESIIYTEVPISLGDRIEGRDVRRVVTLINRGGRTLGYRVHLQGGQMEVKSAVLREWHNGPSVLVLVDENYQIH